MPTEVDRVACLHLQACKNGLKKHVEHLLYYGADIDAQNVNGNTALHVCAVNDRKECAQLLLFRRADAGTQNKQGQTAYHVALIVGSTAVAQLVKSHNPSKAGACVFLVVCSTCMYVQYVDM